MKTVIFDLDGTLVDTHIDIAVSINHVRSGYYGLAPLSPDRIMRLMNTPGLNLAYEFYGVDSYDEQAKEMFEEHYSRQCLLGSRSFEGIRELLDILKKREVEMFVATNAPTKTSRIILQNNMLESFFEDVIGADRVTHVKPHPQMIEKITKKRPKESCWMVGDSMKDIMAAKSAGITPIFAKWGFGKFAVPDIKVEKMAKNPLDVAEMIYV